MPLSFPPFQVNPELIHFFEDKGLKFVGHDTEGKRMEIIELDGKDFGFWHHLAYERRCVINVTVKHGEMVNLQKSMLSFVRS